MRGLQIRNATKMDTKSIAEIFANAFYNDWKSLSKDTNKITLALENGLNIQHYIVATIDEKVVGFISYVSENNRAFTIPINDFKKQFGYFKGFMGAMAIKNDFERGLNLKSNQCYIDILGVSEEHMRKGIASKLISYVIKNKNYSEYTIMVTNINNKAIDCYKKNGFKIYKEEEVKYAKQRGFSQYVHLKFNKDI